MPRTEAEIEADVAAHKAAGGKMSDKKGRLLRAELKALGAVEAPSTKPDVLDLGAVTTTEVSETLTEGHGIDVPTADPFADPEWSFIERMLASMELETGSGQAKKTYHELLHRLRIWRVLRGIVKANGVGCEWPAWASLGLHDSDARPREAAPAPVAARPPMVVMPPPGETAPVLTAPTLPGVPNPLAAMKAMGQSIAAQIAGDLSKRPEPTRTLQAATA